MSHQKNWKIPAQVIRVISGDTVILKCDLGFRVSITIKARLYGIDTPEQGGWDRPQGVEARNALEDLEDLIEEWRIDDQGDEVGFPWLTIETHKNKRYSVTHENKRDSFGHWIVRLIGRDGKDLNRLLVEYGFAEPADFGGDKSPYRDFKSKRNS